MAGIGFELKKIFEKKSIANLLRGYFYASFVSIGPAIMILTFLIATHIIMRQYGISNAVKDLFSASIMYAFIIGFISSSLITNTISRYLADLFYKKRYEKILASCYGSVFLGIVISGVIGFIFYFLADLPLDFELLSYLLIIESAVVLILMAYVSALRDYKNISYSYLYGTIIGILASIITLYLNVRLEISLLFGFNMYFVVVITLLFYQISKYFKVNDGSYFEFLKYYRHVKELAYTQLFYSVSLFIHNIIIWNSDIRIIVGDTYLTAPTYDIASFFAVLSILPAIVLFVVKAETKFYVRYAEYINFLSGAGTLRELDDCKDNLEDILYTELSFIFEVQLMITILFIFIAKIIFPYFGIGDDTYGYFGYLALGYFLMIASYLNTTFMLYFDARSEALKTMSLFLVLHIAFVSITVYLGNQYFGMGTLFAGLVTLVYSIMMLRKIMKNLNYRLYCAQPSSVE